MSQRQPLDELTARECEVLDLVRLGLTNEEIAQRLGITEAGAKYHVSQILSKLGVTTREEAAAAYEQAAAAQEHVAEAFQPRRRRRWAALPLAAKTAGGLVVLAALAGLGLLAWGVVRTSDDGGIDPSGTTFPELYALVLQSVARDGQVLHGTLETTIPLANLGSSPRPGSEIVGDRLVVGRDEYWIDGNARVARTRAATIWVGQYVYYGGSGDTQASRGAIPEGCPGYADPVIGLLFNCNIWGQVSPYPTAPHIESGEFAGSETIAIVFRRLDEAELDPPVEPLALLHLDPESSLPIAWEGPPFPLDLTTFQHEFIQRDALPDDFFDPKSIGYTGEID